ncbi:MAG: RNA polymerase sigma factor [Acidobacteriota bacterium]|nr:RNA polymerase sigma factor [Acidobacteriota bacterium]MDE3262325.1 RNA polymerase sigma factor [Acidobacteriota bacterium]
MPDANKPVGPARLASEEQEHAPVHPVRDERAREDAEERRLLRRFRDQGDLRAFDELVRRTETRVRSVALAILRDRSEAEDAAQEAYLRAFRRASGYRGEGPVGAWLCRISVRAAHDALRRAGRQRRLLEVAGPPGDPGERAGSAEPEEDLRRRIELESALRRLPDDEREALVLKEVAGMTYREISESCGVPLGTVQSRIHRARQRLAEALDPRR